MTRCNTSPTHYGPASSRNTHLTVVVSSPRSVRFEPQTLARLTAYGARHRGLTGSTPRSVRFEPQTLARLTAYAARHPGLTGSGAAALLVEEGLRMDAHPGTLFREGAAGRRAVLVAGPDVWEVIRFVRDTRAAEPELDPEEVLDLVCDHTGLSKTAIRVALDYYGAFPEEVDAQVAAADEADAALQHSLDQTRRLLDV